MKNYKFPHTKKSKKIEVAHKSLLSKAQSEDPVISGFISKFENHLVRKFFIAEESKIALAVSGGVDSVTMLDAFAILAEKYKFKLFVMHFNHLLRGQSSDNDEEFVKDLAAKYHLSFYSISENVLEFANKNTMSVELAARRLRYAYFERISKSLNVNFVATAHSSDDSAETFLLNLLRGSGLTGLSGIPESRKLTKRIVIIRPFLIFNKDSIKEYAAKRGLNWHEDETNSLLFYTRNKIRHKLIPYLQKEFSPAIIEILNRSSKLISGADVFIAQHVEKKIKYLIDEKSEIGLAVKIPVLQTHSDFIQGEIIQTLLQQKFGFISISMQSIDSILKLCSSQTGAIFELGKKLIILKDRENLVFSKRKIPQTLLLQIEPKGEFKAGSYLIKFSDVTKKNMIFDENHLIEYFDLDSIPQNMYLRNLQPGDYFQPLGMKGSMKLSDFLINEKFSLLEKQNLLLMASNNEIIWVCGTRISEKFKVKRTTKRVLKAEMVVLK